MPDGNKTRAVAVAKHHHVGGKIKTLQELVAPVRIQPLKQGAIRPVLQFLLGHRQLVLEFNTEVLESNTQGRRQIRLGRVHISSDRIYPGKALQIFQDFTGPYVPGVQDGVNPHQDFLQVRINVPMRVRNHPDLHSLLANT